MVTRVARTVGRRLGRRRSAPRPPVDLLGAVDSPTSAELWRAVPVTFVGWALDGASLPVRVDVIVGNNPPVPAYVGLSRPDIPVHLGSPAASAWSGWRAEVDLKSWPADSVPIRVTARGANGGDAVFIDRLFTVRRDGFAGQLDDPVEGTVIRDGVLVVNGWAVLDGRPPARVEVMVDDAPAGIARLRIPGHDLPAGTPANVGDFAGFEFRGSVVDTVGPAASVDVVITGVDDSVARFPTRHVSFAPAATSPVDSARAALLRSRSLSMDARAAQTARRAAGGRPRLLVFTPGLGSSSSEIYVHQLLAGLMQHLGSCVVVSPAGGALHTDLERIGAEVLISGRTVASDLESYEGNVRELVPFIVRSDADVVLLNTLNVWTEADAAQRTGVPTLWAIHESFRMSDWLSQFAERACHPYVADRMTASLSASTKLIFDAADASASFSHLAASDCRVIVPRGIDVDAVDAQAQAADRTTARRDQGISEEAIVLLSVGTYEQGQSPAGVVEAFIDVASANDDAVLVVVGDHSTLYSQALHRMVWASGLADRILLKPAVRDISEWYALADVLVVAADTSVPRQAVLEAMAYSVPVLSAGAGGVADVIADGANGWVCPPGDSRALAATMRRVLALQPDARRTVARAARETIQKHHCGSRLGQDYAQIISDIMHEGPAVAGLSPGMEMHRLDEALGVFQAIAETRPSAALFSGGSAESDGSPLAEFNLMAPFVREGIATFITAMAASLAPGARVIDVGAGDAPYRDLFSHAEYITVDWEQSPHDGARRSDIIASAEALPLKDASVDAVVMTEVLEHISDPGAALREMARVLRPQGMIALTVPFVWILHEMPHDYYRYTPSALLKLFGDAGFEQVVVTARGDYFSTLAQLMQMTPQWITAMPTDDGLDDRRHLAGRTLADLSDLFAALAPLDSQVLLPLGFNVAARRAG